MRVFVTGATGYIGSAVTRELAEAGHQVTGMTRLADKSPYLTSLGATPHVADLSQPGEYREAAASHDVLIHVAAEESSDKAAVDRRAVETLLEAADSGAPSSFIYTSGCFVLGETGDEPAGEDAPTDGAPELVAWRVPHERIVLDAARPGLATAVVRPGMVYGGKEGTITGLFISAERDGAAEFVGDGTNHWSPVYRGDVARLYRMAAEEGWTGVLHCSEPAARVGELAMAASRAAGAGGTTRRIRLDEARKRMGAFADALTMDQVMSSPRALSLGWEPRHPPFVESAESVYREWRPGGA